MKVCDFCLEEQGVMDVKLHPDDEVWAVRIEMPNETNDEVRPAMLMLCEDHREKIRRCVARGE